MYDILIWEKETQRYSCIGGPFKTLEEAKEWQKSWWKVYDEISILTNCLGVSNATIKNIGKHDKLYH